MFSILAASLFVFQAPSSVALDNLVDGAWQESAKEAQAHQDDLNRDVELGKKYSVLAEKDLKLSDDKEMLARVQRVGGQLAEIANRTHATALWGDKRLNKFEYTFKLVADKDVNAFSLPGGFIYVNDGLVKYVESDDELAGVLGHEIAHAAFRHVATLQREQEKLSTVTLPLILIAIFTGGGKNAADIIGGSQLVGQALGSGWSVKAEQAADFGGFQYMLKSNYKPVGMLTFMERLARDERSHPEINWGIFRTHPPGKERAEALTQDMEEAGIPIHRSEVATSFRATSTAKSDGTIEIKFGDKHIVDLAGPDASDRAEIVVQRLNAFFDSMPELYDLSGSTDGAILGRLKPLLTVTTIDAAAQKMQPTDLQNDVLKNLRSATYGLAYRVWDVH